MDNASDSLLRCPIHTGRGDHPYDVFLSYNRSDTGKKFADHLYHSLVSAGTIPIMVFRDVKSITIGEPFGKQILDAISRSKVSIPIISKNYAARKWCLRELVHMMKRRASSSHVVLPIFYEVEPSDVGELQGEFGSAYHSHKNGFGKNDKGEEYVPLFEQALEGVSRLEVWPSEKIAGGREGEFVQEVVNTVRRELRRDFQLDVTEDLVGVDDHVKNIKNWADSSATHARMIGIYGMGGIGKTTLAKAIYNELSKDFLDRSYILDIRDTANRKGIPYLQNQMIKEILPKEPKVSNIDEGISVIISRFKCKKVLVLLDDIDREEKGAEQLQALARERDWFMAGSIIIVTTRYEAVLDQSKFEVDYKYPINELNDMHSVLLFNRHAFRMNCSLRQFEDASRKIISTMGGLPLALVVVGSYLFGKKHLDVWEDTLKQLEKHPHKHVREKLKISYDALEPEHQEIFLDISCFFVGKKRKFAMYMWDDCGFFASQGIEELKLRCLIKIGDDGELRMHDQLRKLGRSIVAHGQPPERRSRLWLYEEASTVLTEEKGTESVEAISLGEYQDGQDHPSPDYWELQKYTSEQFKNLRSLRFLELGQAALSGDFTGQLSKLRWLRWSGIEPVSFPAANLHLPNLLVLQMSRNGITEHWGGWSVVAERLKVLDLAYCGDLRCTPDLSSFTELEILNLNGCGKLKKIHPSISEVKSLVSLDLSCCTSLQSLPKLPSALINLKITCRSPTLPQLSYLNNLQELDLSLCSYLISLPKLPSRLLKLRLTACFALILHKLDGLEYLEELSFRECSIDRLDISQLRHLKQLHFKACYYLLEIQGLDGLQSLEEIDIGFCLTIERLVLPGLQGLKRLTVDFGNDLVEIRGLDQAKWLETLHITNCASLETLPDLSGCEKLKSLVVEAPKVTQIRGLERLSLTHLDVSGTGLKKKPELPRTRDDR